MALSQTQMVLQHLVEHGSITSYEAFELYGATRLSAIIYELRHRHKKDIYSQPEVVTTRYGYKTQIAVYKMDERKDLI